MRRRCCGNRTVYMRMSNVGPGGWFHATSIEWPIEWTDKWLRTDRVQWYGSWGEVANLIDLMGGWCFTGLQDFVN